MKYFIITGTSRGLGESLVKQLLHKNHTIFCISRKQNNELKDFASSQGINLYYFSCDLQKNEEIEKVMERIFSSIDFSSAEGIYLINNAGVIDPIKPIGKANTREISENIHVNLIAPMILSTYFIRHTSSFSTKKVVVNISSGAANNPRHGWSTYSSSKAGLDMFTKSVGLEQEVTENPVTMISFSPGVMDTDMQKTIRSTDEEDFTDVNQFIEFNEKGMLRSPDYVAGIILDLIFNQALINGNIYDIKSFV
ncbi:(S)-benzoin forming benzil reductase [Fredinandcohnia quinoae]|uniref:(S)-benzoin forming benzil reductase n=1 Tax=Fredinandcohnia quinoae TaxID=2918902 RepID=A0AAW5E887_9BACI|nr:(S)-benzoin forming benzil reductase [Fredinandcohnia sp. SECRCQ15]MCH1625586.1 (S)-benzoin forming benzil reductase [Fredinandcohnia sp. SECRCQ15]